MERQEYLRLADDCLDRFADWLEDFDPDEVDFAEAALAPQGDRPQAELDPPPGPRLRWLDEKLAQHAFVVLLFYRGFW